MVHADRGSPEAPRPLGEAGVLVARRLEVTFGPWEDVVVKGWCAARYVRRRRGAVPRSQHGEFLGLGSLLVRDQLKMIDNLFISNKSNV